MSHSSQQNFRSPTSSHSVATQPSRTSTQTSISTASESKSAAKAGAIPPPIHIPPPASSTPIIAVTPSGGFQPNSTQEPLLIQMTVQIGGAPVGLAALNSLHNVIGANANANSNQNSSPPQQSSSDSAPSHDSGLSASTSSATSPPESHSHATDVTSHSAAAPQNPTAASLGIGLTGAGAPFLFDGSLNTPGLNTPKVPGSATFFGDNTLPLTRALPLSFSLITVTRTPLLFCSFLCTSLRFG